MAPQQNSRRLAPLPRTYNWLAEELTISYNSTSLSNPTCTRLEPPVTWLAASGSRVKVTHSGGCSEDERAMELALNQPLSCASVIEVTVPRSFAEASLRVLRNKGFAREDIYRMLDKGPWVLSFDIPNALPRLFASLEVNEFLTTCATMRVKVFAHFHLTDLLQAYHAIKCMSRTNNYYHYLIMNLFPRLRRLIWDYHRVKQYILYHTART